jgi:hypothetical protein
VPDGRVVGIADMYSPCSIPPEEHRTAGEERVGVPRAVVPGHVVGSYDVEEASVELTVCVRRLPM